MIAAIYARRSQEQHCSDEAKSVTRQVAGARAFAETHQWVVASEHVYVDDGVSGAEWLDREMNRLIEAAQRRPRPFDVLVTLDIDRVGRDGIRTVPKLNEVYETGCRIFFYQDGKEVHLRTPIEVFMLQAQAFGAADYRDKVRLKTRAAMFDKARRGHVAGGTVYGYRNVRRDDHVDREIFPAEAAVVRRIFDEIAGGRGFARIARGLNADGVPSPGRGRGWAMTGVRAIAFREIYRGRYVYGQTRWVDRGGTKVKQDCPPAEWVTLDAPALRIVTEEAWTAAHARLERTRQTYVVGGRLGGRPDAGIEARHLLSGFVLCGRCGGSMHAIKRTSRRGAPRVYYVCNGWRVNGMCTNSWSLPLVDLDAAVLSALREDVLTPDLVDDVVARASQLWSERHGTLDTLRRQIQGDLRKVERELGRFTEAIAAGEALPTLVEALRVRERHRADLKARLEHVDGLERAGRPTLTTALRDQMRTRLESWGALLGRNPAEARPILRLLLTGRLVVTPRQLPDGRFYEFTGTATYGPLLSGVVAGLVPPG